MLGEIAGLLSGAGAIAGAMGGGQGTASMPQSGYQTLPAEIQDYMLKGLFPQIQAFNAGKYEGLPKRRLDASDFDPVFGSTARQGIQRYLDFKNPLGKQPTNGDADKNAAMEAQLADIEARMLARQMLGQADPGMKTTNVGGVDIGGRLAAQYGAGLYDDTSLAAIGKQFMDAQKKGGRNSQSGSLWDEYLQGINVQPQMEAMRRKSMP